MTTHACLIPPIPHLKEFGEGEKHLVLAHLLEDSDYYHHYRRQGKLGKYMILDNSAWELKEPIGIESLISLAADISAEDLILPDVLYDSQGTVNAVFSAVVTLSTTSLWKSAQKHHINLAIVPQGATAAEWGECLTQCLEIVTDLLPINYLTICIPKSCDDKFHGGRKHLINKYVRAVWNFNTRVRLKIHLLGWGRDLWKLSSCVKEAAYPVATTDSAKPFVYAMHNIPLLVGQQPIPEYPTRPEDYFYRIMTEDQLQIARHNASVFQLTAEGKVR